MLPLKKLLKCLPLLTATVLPSLGADECSAEDLAPGVGHIMIEVGYRYSALYFAAQQKRWDFAEYQLEEIEEALDRLTRVQPGQASNVEQFLDTVVGDMEKALDTQNQERFAAVFEKLRAGCMACHAKNGVEFIQLSVPQRHFSPVLE